MGIVEREEVVEVDNGDDGRLLVQGVVADTGESVV